MRDKLVRNLEARRYFELFLVSAVVSILVIRFFLHITHYPQLGGSGLHIAHMLWGGFFMATSIILLFSFLNTRVVAIAAILGGVGFGTFIDELGKFITRDNNYFFEPTVALIYVVFIFIFFAFRLIEKEKRISQEEYLSNAFELTREVVLENAGAETKERAEEMLENIDSKNPTAMYIRKILSEVDLHEEKATFYEILRRNLDIFYRKIVKHRYFNFIIILLVVLISAANLYKSSDFITRYLAQGKLVSSFIDMGQFISSLLAVSFSILGFFWLKKSRVMAYTRFKDSIYISIFLTQFFDFYDNQFGAVFILIVNLIALWVVEYVIFEERHIRHAVKT